MKSNSVVAKGTLVFEGANLKRTVTATTTAKVTLPASCTMSQPCSLVQLGLGLPPPTGPGFESATCTNSASGAGACDCDVVKRIADTSTTTYTLAGNTITTADSKTYDYCVTGSKMTYRDKFFDLVDANIVMSK